MKRTFFLLIAGVFLVFASQSPGQPVTLLPAGSVWKYLDDGSDQGTAWQSPAFDDSSWASGRAQLGYGDGDESTVVSFGPFSGNKYITTYFRGAFSVADPSIYAAVEVRLLRDDGAIVYLNGVEVFRSNMPGGFIDFFTLAASTIPNNDEFVFFINTVDPALLLSGVNVIAVEVHQANPGSSDLSFNLSLVATPATGPPTILRHPAHQAAGMGGTATFRVVARGAPPLRYQWDFNGADIAGATNATLTLAEVAAEDAGKYRLTVANSLGSAVSSKASLTVVDLTGDLFQIANLSTNNALAIEHGGVTGDDRGGVAAGFNELFINGDTAAARFNLADLSGEASAGQIHDSLVSDLRSGTVYVLANDATPIMFGQVNALIEINSATGMLTTNTVPLSAVIELNCCYGDVGIFSGFGRVVVHTGTRVFSVLLPSGQVQDLGPMSVPLHTYTENWGYWGVAEFFNGSVWLVRARDRQTIVRTRVPDGLTFPVASFLDLGDLASLTVSPVNNRWYFHHQGTSQFRSGNETAGFADATLVHASQPYAPEILGQPRNRVGREGRNARLEVVALGHPLTYQWQLNGQDVTGATNATLFLIGLTTNQAGFYSVTISNELGVAISSNASLSVLNADTLANFVAVLGAPGADVFNADVQTKIVNSDHFEGVDAFLVSNGRPAPALEDLETYGALLVYSDITFSDPEALGNVLADYVDGGGGVVLATFGFYSFGGSGIQGRLKTGGYLPFTTGSASSGPALGLVADSPSHPILDGVTSFEGGFSSYRNTGISLAPDSELVAHWSNGELLVGTRQAFGGRVVGLNFYPPSSDVHLEFWDARTDGGLLMGNALLWAAGGDDLQRAPALRIPPVDRTVLEGTDTTLSVRAYGSLPLTYQWISNGVAIANATNRDLLLTNIRIDQSGQYQVVVSNAFGSLSSEPATLRVHETRGVAGYFTDNNRFASDPAAAIIQAGFTPLEIREINTFDFSRVRLLLLDEASDFSLSPELRARLPDIQMWVEAGGKLIVHDDSVRTRASQPNPFLLGLPNVLAANPGLGQNDVDLLPPANTLVSTGRHGTLDNNSLDGGYFSGGIVVGETLPAGVMPILSHGSVSNQVLALSYGLGDGFIYYSTIALSYFLSQNDTVALRFRTIYAPNVIEYVATLVPSGPPHILDGPNDTEAPAGSTATFSASVTGQLPLQYQWSFRGTPLPGATNRLLRLNNVSTNQAGIYSVMVSNSLGAEAGSEAVLTVVPRVVVGVFDDPAFVNTVSAGPNAVSVNVQRTLDKLGHEVRPFTNILGAMTNDILLFPYFNAALAQQLSSPGRAALQAYVLGGGVAIVQGTAYNLEFINSVFGLSLVDFGAGGADFTLTAQAAGTPFADDPAMILANVETYAIWTESLPAGARSLYSNFNQTSLALIPYGAGSIVFMGWTWYDASPRGGQDGGWLKALASAVQSRGIAPLSANVVRPFVLTGSIWQYLDDGSDQGTTWREPGYDDRSWASGGAPLGYGDGDETTVVNFGPDPEDKFITTYFRQEFNVPDTSVVSGLMLRLLHDDGAAVYLNGVEISRRYLPSDASFNSWAWSNVDYNEERTFFSTPIDAGLLRTGTNLLAVEIHQVSPGNSDISLDLELLGTVPSSAPAIRIQPAGQTVLASATVVLSVVAAGTLPLHYQWRVNGQDLPGGTNAILLLDHIAANQTGIYSVVLSNALGSVASSNAAVTAVALSGHTFQIAGLSADNAGVVDPYQYTGESGGAIAASLQQLFYSGQSSRARFGLADLSRATFLGGPYYAAVSDLQTETVYSLANGTNLLTTEGGIVTALMELDSVDGTWTGASVKLSQPIELKNPYNRYGEVGIFAGVGRIVVHDGVQAWNIDLPSGRVVELGAVAVPAHARTSTWAYWGVAEFFQGAIWLVYVRDSRTIVHTRVPDGLTTEVANFQSLSDMASITVSLPFNRWYFHHTGSSQFSSFYQTLGFADAAFVSSAPLVPPSVIKHPVNQTIAGGSTTVLSVAARGTGPLLYRWLLEGVVLEGATSATLTLTNATPEQSGLYSVIVGNSLGAVLSSSATVTVVPLVGGTFRIANLTTNNSQAVDHAHPSGGSRAGLAASAHRIFYSGANAAHFDLADLSGGTSLPRVYDGLAGDLGTETVYTLADGTNLFDPDLRVITTLRELSGLTGELTGSAIPLSEPIHMANNYGHIGIFAGVGRIVLTDGVQAWTIELPSGQVLGLGPLTVPQHLIAGIGTYWGVAEFFDGAIWLVYVRDNRTIVRTRVIDGLTTVVATFQYLGDMPAITVSLPFNRWYFRHEFPSEFSRFQHTLGFADAEFLSSAPSLAPTIVKSPLDRTVATGGTVAFQVAAQGTGPLHYQWSLDGTAVSGSTNAALALTNVNFSQAGSYRVEISNTVGGVTSAPAFLRLITPVTVAVFDDPTFVSTWGDAFAGSDTVQASLRSLGHDVTTFTDIALAAQGDAPLLFPAFDVADLALAMPPAAREGLQDYVARGGVLILHGAHNDFRRVERFFHAVFGMSVQAGIPYGPYRRTTHAAGTAFADDPESLPYNEYTIGLLASLLPPEARSLYENSLGESVVASLPFGGGKIIYLAWNWRNAVPLGPHDGGWLTVLGSAIEATQPVPRSPEVLTPVVGRTVIAGTSVQLRAAAAGSALTYQWLFNGVPLAGQTNTVLQLTKVSSSNAGTYSVGVSNGLGSVVGSIAVLTVMAPLSVGVFDDRRFVAFESDNLQAALNQLGHDVRPFTAIQGAMANQVLAFPSLRNNPLPELSEADVSALRTFVQQGGLIIVHGNDTTIPFLDTLFGISLLGHGFTGDHFFRTIEASGTPFADGPAILPSNRDTFALWSASLPLHGARHLYTARDMAAVALIPAGAGHIVYLGWNWGDFVAGNGQDGGWMEVLDNAVRSRTGLLVTAPTFSRQPEGGEVRAGLDVTLTAGFLGSMPLQPRWFFNGELLPDATNATLALPAVTTNHSGNYHVVIANPAGTATSQVATLTVRPTRGVVGYYSDFDPSTSLEASIAQANFTPLQILDLSQFDLSRLTILMINQRTDYAISPALQAHLPAIEAWVNAGGKLIVHDRYVSSEGGQANPFLLGLDASLLRSPGNNIEFIPPADNLVVAGPHGTLNNMSLDGGSWSYFGSARMDALPPRAQPIFRGGFNTNLVAGFSYGLGAGSIYYATLPLPELIDYFGPLGDAVRMVYVPNLLEHAIRFTVTGPPVLLMQLRRSGGVVGGGATLRIATTGEAPLTYQWFFEGNPLPGATNATLVFTGLTTNHAGHYRVSVRNTLGVANSSETLFSVVQAAPFRIATLGATGSQVVEHDFITGDDRGGIAVSATHVFYAGDVATGRFSAANLSGGTNVPRYDAMVSNLRTETPYTLASGTTPISGGGIATALIEIDGSTGALKTNRIELSVPLNLTYDTGIFAGYDAVVLYSDGRVYRIHLPLGLVEDLGAMSYFPHSSCENWAYWGVAEYFAGSAYLTYVRDFNTIVRTRVPDGFTTNVATFTSLSDMCSFTVSLPRNRWYFHYEGSAQFGGSSETLGYASATFDRPPRFATPIANRTIAEDTNTGPIQFTVQDTETPAAQLLLSATSSNPLLLPDANIAFGGVNPKNVTLTPAPDQFGTAVVSLIVFDAIGQFTNRNFSLTVNPVNDPPTFRPGPNLAAAANSGPQTVAGWATDISPGPPNEAGQSIAFLTTNDNNDLLAEGPAVTADGTLTFTPAANAGGTAMVTIILQDDGGTNNGGVDVSPPAQFSITVSHPRLTAFTKLPTGEFRLTIVGGPGRRYTILASTDLVTWIPIADMSSPTGTTEFNDLEASNFPWRFYRVIDSQ